MNGPFSITLYSLFLCSLAFMAPDGKHQSSADFGMSRQSEEYCKLEDNLLFCNHCFSCPSGLGSHRIDNWHKSSAHTLDFFISRLPVDRVGTMVCPRLTGPAAFFATITILSLFSFSPVEMRDPLAVTISRMKKMYQEKEGDGVQDTPTQWIPRRPAGKCTP